ncbi:outer membrane protein TolC [Chryseobacterium sp. PvR013]|uniref:TolC family protein n=1 Tax=Chryseobacterium sp. PvR013 TaxID=2806595 RepID=UPI001AE3A546|nr:TolC family protein [Chryseobacterium sp. PvR013]MBP1164485.1 outer membrane protein TolC [Chryseobacterium sp. PvR013]
MNIPYTYPVRCFLVLITLLLSLSLEAQTGHALSYFITQAQANSPLLNDYNNQVMSNKIDSLKLRATYGFIVAGEANAGYSPNIRGWGYDNALTNGQSLFAGVRVAKEFISRNNLDTRLKAYDANIAQILAQKNISIQTLNKQITDQYIATYTSQQRYELSKEIINLLNHEDLLLKKLTQSSVFKQTDYLTFKVTLQQNELTLQQQQAEWQSNYALLNYLCGIIDTQFPFLPAPNIDKTLNPIDFKESMYSQAFKADSLKIANDSEIIKYNYKPKITAFSDGGYQTSFAQTPYKNFGLGIGLGVSIPIYDGHQKKMLLQQNQLALQTRQKYIEQTERQYQQQIFQIQNQMEQYYKMIGTANEQINYARTLVEANAKQLPTGDVRMVDFILSINNLLSLRSNIIQYHTTLFNLQNQMQYLIIQ